MMFESKITKYFNNKLVKRIIELNLSEKLTDEENLIISKIGLPNGVLDFQFINDIFLLSKTEIKIGNTFYNNIILDTTSKMIIRDDAVFLSKSLKNLVLQLYAYDSLWQIIIPEKKFGNYREDRNHKKYAQFLESELLKIDQDLLKNDNGYFWGSLIEDIEFGIVG
ncbi:hypothetical protein [Flavobacterium olei]|uniref:hypothetical protein n=1 Tax=Flavobacterium olei TaxID=1886782 RepID=UPI00321A50F3